jgi:paraquat-inducible protein B
MEVAAARAAAQPLPQLEVEQQGKATMERKDTITALGMLRAAVAVAQAQLVEVPHQAMQATVEQALQAVSPALASPEQAAAQGVEMVAAQPKVEQVDRAAGATAAGQMETQVLPELLTRAAAAARVGFKQARITRAKLVVQASSSSKCHRLFMQHSQAA